MPPPALPPLDRVDPARAWEPWVPTDQDPWNLKWAGHLYRRAGCGATPDQLRQAVQDGLDRTYDLLTRETDAGRETYAFLEQTGEAIARQNNPTQLRGWWLYCLLYTPQPLRERLTLFWHNHFATSIAKVGRTLPMFQQNQLLRRHALGKFGPMLLEVSQDAAMLVWLDSNSNVKGKPNENYAREVMELFSLGVGHYTEKDIREAARAFTGWHTDGDRFDFNAALHDAGPKTVHGQTGNWDGDDVVRICLAQPACARFLVRKLYRELVSEAAAPPDPLIEPLAELLRRHDYDVGLLVRTMLRSRHFFSDYAYRQRVKSPVEFALTAVRAVGGSVGPEMLMPHLEAMGQQLFAPPNVKGWEGGRAWLNTAMVLARHNFAQQVVAAAGLPTVETPNDPEAIVVRILDATLQGDVRPASRQRLVAFVADGKPQGADLVRRVRQATHAAMTMPEFQLA